MVEASGQTPGESCSAIAGSPDQTQHTTSETVLSHDLHGCRNLSSSAEEASVNLPLKDHDDTVLIMTVDDQIKDDVMAHLDGNDLDQTKIQCDDAGHEERVLDDITWQGMLDSLRKYLKLGSILAAVLMHPGRTLMKDCRGDDIYGGKNAGVDLKKRIRVETALALRLLQLIQLLFVFAVPWMLVVPMMDHAVSILDLPDYGEVRGRIYTR